MVFEKMKEYFKQKKEKKDVFYVIERENIETNYIIEQKMLEIIFSGNWGIQEFINCGFAEKMGWHVGTDNKVYERFKLNERGKIIYDYSEAKSFAPPYFMAYQEMCEGVRPKHLRWEKERLADNIKKNSIKKIYLYQEKELSPKAKEQEKVINIFHDVAKNGKEYELKDEPIDHHVYKR